MSATIQHPGFGAVGGVGHRERCAATSVRPRSTQVISALSSTSRRLTGRGRSRFTQARSRRVRVEGRHRSSLRAKFPVAVTDPARRAKGQSWVARSLSIGAKPCR